MIKTVSYVKSTKILLLDEFIIEIFEFLKAVIIFKKFVNCAFFITKKLLNRGAALTTIWTPESAV